ncbi:MAG: efflux RND transporter periplasmic adaptor subunit [Pseudomonadota bacterium]|nr:efflux RND transporter periplasmic adaptor subunit [Pseudomonadota bacterium]
MAHTNSTKALLTAAAVAAVLGVGALSLWASQATSKTESAVATAAPAVDIALIEQKPVRLWTEFSARLQAVEEVGLRPQVSGTIVDVRFEDGQRVGSGEVLFVIDPRPYQAAVAQAEADLAAAQERHRYAMKELQRARALSESDSISESILDERSNAVSVIGNEIKAAEARLADARIDLDHAFVKAPIDGRVSRAEITVGNLVQAGADAPLLTSIVSDREVYADFEVDEDTYLRFVRSSARTLERERAIPVKLRVGGEGGILVEGNIHTFDNRIDPSTGTIRARALFSNETGALLPGMFARVELGSPEERSVVLLSDKAILTDQDRKFVYVVGADGKTAYRPVTLGASINGKRVVESGLQAGDRVVTSGLMGIRPDMAVEPKADLLTETTTGPDQTDLTAAH